MKILTNKCNNLCAFLVLLYIILKEHCHIVYYLSVIHSPLMAKYSPTPKTNELGCGRVALDLIYHADAAILCLRRSQVGAAAALHVAVLKPQEMSASSHHSALSFRASTP